MLVVVERGKLYYVCGLLFGVSASGAKAIAEKGISISFDVTQVIARKYSAVYGFQSAEAAKTAAEAIRKAAR